MTSNKYCKQVCPINEQLDEIYESVDPTIYVMALSMRLKHEKYQRDLSKMNMILLLYITIIVIQGCMCLKIIEGRDGQINLC